MITMETHNYIFLFIFLFLSTLNLGIYIAKNGESREDYNAIVGIIDYIITIGLLLGVVL